MIKKKYLIFMLVVILITVSFNNVVHAGIINFWKEKQEDPLIIEYDGLYETYAEAVDRGIRKLGAYPQLVQYGIAKKKDIKDKTLNIGQTEVFSYGDGENENKIVKRGEVYLIYITRIEDTFKWSKGRDVPQYKVRIEQIAASSGGSVDVLEDLDYFKPSDIGEEEVLISKVGVIIGVINVVGVIISVITLMLIGFRYMTGSAEEKAGYKKTMMPWLIGAIILFSATTLPNIIYTISDNVWNNKTTTQPAAGGPAPARPNTEVQLY